MTKVKIFTTVSCPYCLTLKQFLKEQDIEFEEVDVGRDQKAAEEMIEKSGQMGVPVTEIDGQIVGGFDKQKISEILKIK